MKNEKPINSAYAALVGSLKEEGVHGHNTAQGGRSWSGLLTMLQNVVSEYFDNAEHHAIEQNESLKYAFISAVRYFCRRMDTLERVVSELEQNLEDLDEKVDANGG